MGTRAAFWMGDPRDLENRKWLGCVAWDGYEWAESKVWTNIHTEEQWLEAIDKVKFERTDFADPQKGGWPFPWTNDVFLTDYTYAFFDNSVHYVIYHSGPFRKIDMPYTEADDDLPDDPTFKGVPAESPEWDRSQPDSIMILSAR